PEARDAVTEEEVLLFEPVTPGRVQPVWHTHIETGAYALWRSITPEIALTHEGTVLLSAMWCFNGTGGCRQEFLLRHTDGTWAPVVQNWVSQLPRGFAQRMHKGVRIEPNTLQVKPAFMMMATRTAAPRSDSSSISPCTETRSTSSIRRSCLRSNDQ